MLSPEDIRTARALLAWQVELGADEAIGDTPVNRYELEAQVAPPKAPADPAPAKNISVPAT